MTGGEKLYKVISPTKIKLLGMSWEDYLEHAQMVGMTPKEYTRHLWLQGNVGDVNGGQGAAVPREEFLPDITLSENIEDRRQDPEYIPDATMKQIWGNMADVPPQAQTFGPNPLANSLGFPDVGRVPAPAPQVLGPFQPRPFIPEGY